MTNSSNAVMRQIQIDLIADNPNPIVDWFNNIWSQIHVIKTNVYHKNGNREFIYYIKTNNGNKWIFYNNIKQSFWCNYEIYWREFEAILPLDRDGIIEITKILIENAMNSNISILELRNRKDAVMKSINKRLSYSIGSFIEVAEKIKYI